VNRVPTRGRGSALTRSAAAALVRRPGKTPGVPSCRGARAWALGLAACGAVARLTEGQRAGRTAPQKGRPPPGGRAGVAERSRSGCGRQNRLPRKLRCAQDQVTNRLRGDSIGYVFTYAAGWHLLPSRPQGPRTLDFRQRARSSTATNADRAQSPVIHGGESRPRTAPYHGGPRVAWAFVLHRVRAPAGEPPGE
jgi:hypothetical protein